MYLRDLPAKQWTKTLPPEDLAWSMKWMQSSKWVERGASGVSRTVGDADADQISRCRCRCRKEKKRCIIEYNRIKI
jgi:hypothetical protein